MKVIIFGATGRIGGHLVQQALAQGHIVTAFARDPGKVQVTHENLRMAKGDVMDPAAVANAISGQDAVLCSLGSGRKGVIRSEGTHHIIQGMEKTGVKRLICQTTLGAGDSKGNLNFFWKYIMFGLLLREAYDDHERQEQYVFQSRLNWTIVRPAAFTDGPKTGVYRHGFSAKEKNITLKISCADVADFMLRQLKDDTYLRKTPGLSY
jgi:putative NADH-flavin reductase